MFCILKGSPRSHLYSYEVTFFVVCFSSSADSCTNSVIPDQTASVHVFDLNTMYFNCL